MENFQSYGMANFSSNIGYFQPNSFQKNFQQIPQNFPYSYQNQVPWQNSFNHSTNFGADKEGKIILKQHQCNQCLQLCHFEESLNLHTSFCQKISCPYILCRDLNFLAIYASKEEFKFKDDLLKHINEKHLMIKDDTAIENENVSSVNLNQSFENEHVFEILTF